MKLELSKRCRDIRQKANISIKDWANMLGLKKEQITNFEKGVIEIPTLVLVEYVKLKKESEKEENEKKN